MDLYTVVFLWILAIGLGVSYFIYIIVRLSTIDHKLNLIINHLNLKDEEVCLENICDHQESDISK